MAAERKFQVFVSSTLHDLRDERQAMVAWLLNMGMIPVGMELSPADSDHQWRSIQRLIDASDYYLVLVGGRYGTLSPIGISYTHREYVYAQTKGIPVLALIHERPDSLPAERRETTPEGAARLRDFGQLLERKCVTRSWTGLRDLQDAVRFGMAMMQGRFPRPGWVRDGERSASSDELEQLRTRIAELESAAEEAAPVPQTLPQILARQSQPVNLDYHCHVYVKGDCKLSPGTRQTTWGQVMLWLLPMLLTPLGEEALQEGLEECLQRQALADQQKHHADAHAVRNLVLEPDTFNTIKVFLRGLGLVRRCLDEERETSWMLTPLGDRVMTELTLKGAG